MSKKPTKLSQEKVKKLIQERVQRRLDEHALAKAINEGLITEGKIWDSLKSMIGDKDPEHSTKITGTLKRALDQAADKTVKKMFEQFEKDFPGFPNIKSSEKFEKGLTSLGLMYQSVKEAALHGQMPVEVGNAIIITLKQYTEALIQDTSTPYKFFKEGEEEENLEEISDTAKGALAGAGVAGVAAAPAAALGAASTGISAATTAGIGMAAGAAEGVGGILAWLGGSAATGGSILGALGAIGAPIVVGAGLLMLGKWLFGSNRKGMLKKLLKLYEPVDPAKAAPYSGERAAQASGVAQAVGQGNFKAANQGYTAMQNSYAQTGVQQLQQQPQVIQQIGGALEDAIGAENAAAFVAVASGQTKLEDLPQLQQDVVRAVLGQFETGDPEENIEDAIEVAEAETELVETKEKLEDEGEADPTGGGEDLPQETPLSITNSNAEQEEPLIAVIQDLGLPADAAASIATKMVDYLNKRQIPVSEGNLKRLASRFAVRLKEQMRVTDTRTSTRMKRPPQPDEEEPTTAPVAGAPGDPSDPAATGRAAMVAMAARATAEPAPTQQKSPEEIAKLKADIAARKKKGPVSGADLGAMDRTDAERAAADVKRARAGDEVEAGGEERAQLDAGDSAIGKILVRAFEQAPAGDPLKTPEAIAVFSDPAKLKSLFDEIGLVLRIQLQKRQYAPKQIDALLEHLLRQTLLVEQADKRLGRWKELANI